MAIPLDLVIRGGTVVLPGQVKKLDIGLSNGKIAQLADCISDPHTEVIEAEGLTIMPGAVDVHVHFNEPGMGAWEGFETGSAALAAGGCTTYFDMPLNGRPPTVTVDALLLKRSIAKGKSYVNYGFWGGLVPGRLEQLAPLAEAGVIGFKAFMSSPGTHEEGDFREVDDLSLMRGMEYIAQTGLVLALHAESEPLTAALTAELRGQGRTDYASYAMSRPIEAEREAVRRALYFAEETNCPLHFVHISSAAAVRDIMAAKRSGRNVTLETCTHYLSLTTEDMRTIGATAKCAPPLRDAGNKEELWSLLAEGAIDMVSSDHSPCPPELKEHPDYFAIWGGISGAQHTLELMLDEGCRRRGIPLPRLAEVLSSAPAGRFNLSHCKGSIQIGMDADLVLIDLNHAYKVNKEQLYDRHQQSPYIGREISCKVIRTISGGQTVYEAEGSGRDGHEASFTFHDAAAREVKPLQGNHADGPYISVTEGHPDDQSNI
ncbi:allantoinase AllB [Paenibacillus sp. GCM10023252]|uniref:allantoinase AllB n=1 Tax=Paenibacillus sp. GCM10023252 TaxID=3252649 RepID=UPI00361BAF85